MEPLIDEINDCSDCIDQGLEVVASLEQFQDFVITKRSNEESLTSNEAKLIDIGMENIRLCLGMPNDPKMKIAVEGLSSSRTSSEEHHLALESSILDTLVRILKGIRDFISGLFTKFIALFKSAQLDSKKKENEDLERDLEAAGDVPEKEIHQSSN